MRHYRIVHLSLCFLLLALPLAALAQTSPFLLDYQPDGRPGLRYRFQHPHFSGDVDADFLMGFHELAVEVPLGSDLVLVLAAPVINWSFNEEFQPSEKTAFGNFTVAAHIRNLGSQDNFSLLFAVLLPTAQDKSFSLRSLGLLSNPALMQTFTPDLLTMQAHFAAQIPATTESYVRLELGPDVLFPTGDADSSPEVQIRYGIGLGVQTARLGASIEFAGVWDADGNGRGFSERSYHLLAAGVEYVGAVLRPALYYEIPTDELDTILDGLIGVRLTVKP